MRWVTSRYIFCKYSYQVSCVRTHGKALAVWQFWVWVHQNPNPINLPRKSIGHFAHRLFQTLCVGWLQDIYLENIRANFRGFERTGRPWLFGNFGFGYIKTQTQNAIFYGALVSSIPYDSPCVCEGAIILLSVRSLPSFVR